MDDLRAAVSGAADYQDAAARGLEALAGWDSEALGEFLGDALRLAALQGRDAVFREVEGEEDTDLFADDTAFGLAFKEQIEFFEQKRAKPTRSWLDALRGDHDRSFVIAGATDIAMLEDFQRSLAKSFDTVSFRDFQKDFDRIASEYGWEFNGDRQWRARTIFETNFRTSYAAGRLAQMRDPDVLALRPFWQYRHGVTREPRRPRPKHVGWDGIILPADDPFWSVAYPPNGWKCSCGVVTLSWRDLERLGKSGPDKAPILGREPYLDPLTGKLIEKTQFIDYGFDYQPGDLWERGLVPSNLIREAGGITRSTGLIVEIDTPRPLDELISTAKPFTVEPLDKGLDDNAYIDAFLEPFGATRGKAVPYRDKAGDLIPISGELFRERGGALKVKKRGREIYTAMLAETIMDPDEIWIGVRAVKVPASDAIEYVVDRRYIRVDPDTGFLAVFQIGQKEWEEITAYYTDHKRLNIRRGGKLIYERKK